MTMQQIWAESYLDHGYNVIPVQRQSKKPAIRWKEYQERKMTLLEARGLWGPHPEWNLAVVCGRNNGLVVVDADNEDAMRFCMVHLDQTPMRVRTSRGMHFYYRHPGVNVASRTRVHTTLPIDIKGEGGLATGAGSVHSSGFIYAIDDDCDLSSIRELPRYIPAWFPEPTRTPTPPGIWRGESEASEHRVRAYLSRIDGAGSGSRSNAAFRVAASVVRDFGMGVELGFELISEWNQKNDPPLDLNELRDIVVSAYRYGKAPVGNKI